MKHGFITFWSWALKLLLVAAALVCCLVLKDKLETKFHKAEGVAYYQLSETEYVDSAALKQQLSELNSTLTEFNKDSDWIQSLTKEKCSYDFYIVSLDDSSMESVAAILHNLHIYDKPVLFLGSAPETELISRYDKAWYLGSDPALAGEKVGYEIAMRERNKPLTDNNSNLQIDYRVFGSSNSSADALFIENLTEETEHYGVYLTECKDTTEAAVDTEGSDSEDDIETLEPEETLNDKELYTYPDLLITIGSDGEQQALDFLKSTSADLEYQPYLAALTFGKMAGETAIQDGFNVAAYYNADLTMQYIGTFIENFKNGKDIADGTDFLPYENCFFTLYELLNA